MRLSQPKFGESIGLGRMTINHYEHGRRHDTRQPIQIPKTTDMACGAAWLGVNGYTGILAAAAQADAQVGDNGPRLPSNVIEPWHEMAAQEELARRGITVGDYHLAFPLLITLALWSQITRWCPERGIDVPILHPVISSSVPGIAILEFSTANNVLYFKTFCVGERG
jgi:hypothetical protein